MTLDEINALYEKATPRDWVVTTWSDKFDGGAFAFGIDGPEHFGFGGNDMNHVVLASERDSGVSTNDNAQAIVALHNAWPSIYRELKAARAMFTALDDRSELNRCAETDAYVAAWQETDQ